MKNRFSLHIRQKLALIIGLIIFLTIPLFGYFQILWNKKQASMYLTNLKNEKLKEEKKHAKILAINLALFAEKGFENNDFSLLELAMNDLREEEPHLLYAFFINTNLTILADTRPENIGKNITDPYILEAALVTGFTTQEFLQNGQNVLVTALPVTRENTIVGVIRLVYSLAFIEHDNIANQKTLQSQNRQILMFTLILTIVFVILGICVGIYTSRMITVPIKKLTEGVEEVSRGNLSIRFAHKHNDEFGMLAKAFNKMISDIRITREILENYSRSFEGEVQSKSRHVKRLQNQLIIQESMASFGKLVTNIIHTLPIPLNFMYGSMITLTAYIGELQKLMFRYDTIELTSDKKNEIDKIKKDIDYEFLLNDIQAIIAKSEKATYKVQEIIMNLEQFVKEPQEVDLGRIDINNYLQLTIELFQKRWEKDNIKLITILEPLPGITYSIGKLNQVFMTLITNALEAIKRSKNKSKGSIEIQSSNTNGRIKLCIKDNGTGIKEEDFPKLFEPFFSTKDYTDGVGLGLFVSKSIIEKLGGTIYAYNNKNENGVTFVLELPVV